jgi:hypothetical protein
VKFSSKSNLFIQSPGFLSWVVMGKLPIPRD